MQGDLFASAGLAASQPAELTLDAEQLRAWQQRLHGHQAPLFRGAPERTSQTTLFGDSCSAAVRAIDPLALTPLPLTFWRWPDSPHVGAAIRFCSDVPRSTKARRALEQALIQHWLPPFNKETRQRWATPFTAEL